MDNSAKAMKEKFARASRIAGGPRRMAMPNPIPPAPVMPVVEPVYAGRIEKPGIFNANGSTAAADSLQVRAERVIGAGRQGASNPIRLGVGEIMPERAGRTPTPNFTLRGSVPPGQALVPSDGFDPAMKGASSPLPAPKPPAGPQKPLAFRAGKAFGQMTSGVRGGLGASALVAPAAVGLQGLAMDHDDMRSQFYDDPNVSGFDKVRQGVRDVKTLAFPAATGIVGAVAGAPAGPVGAVAGGLGGGVIGGIADRAIEAGLGESALDQYKAGRKGAWGVGPYKDNSEVIGPNDPRYEQMANTPHGGIVGQDELPSAQITRSTFKDTPFTRKADPEAELARQQGNNERFIPAVNAALASRVTASGGSSFRDAAAQGLFNTKQQAEGTGIKVTNEGGTPTFSNDPTQRKLYRAADGSVTDDWSKTKDYADQIQRNAQDQSRLAELTRGAALSGDKEAVARLTAGDGRLQAIAADAATERDLRQAVRGGSAKAAQVLATMESARATAANQQADLGLRRAALMGAQEDRDLNRQLRQDALAERVASNRLSAQKDQREQALKGVETLDKQLEQYATVDGKLDGERLSRIRGLAANLQKSPGQTDESYRKDVTTLISLAGKLDGGQSWYDKALSQAGNGGTDLRSWGKNQGWRGGLVTDQGDHFSARQWNALTDDEKRVAKLLGMKGEK